MNFGHEKPGEASELAHSPEGGGVQEGPNMEARTAEATIEGLKEDGWNYVGIAETGADVYDSVKRGKAVQIVTVNGRNLIFERDEELEA